MTRKEWETKTLRAEEKALGVPPGWWGNYHDVRSPRGVRVKFSGRWWIVRNPPGVILSRHGSRSVAIRKAKAVERTLS